MVTIAKVKIEAIKFIIRLIILTQYYAFKAKAD